MRELLETVINNVIDSRIELAGNTRIRRVAYFGLIKCIEEITDGCYLDRRHAVEVIEQICRECRNLLDNQEADLFKNKIKIIPDTHSGSKL